MISILHLGKVDYARGLSLQKELVEARKGGRVADVLLLLEHTPVITLGRNAKRGNILASAELLVRRGVEVFDCDRGGDVTFHGPGQLVGYPIFDLRARPSSEGSRKAMGAIEYVRKLEEVLIRSCADFGIRAKRICGLTGVWTDSGETDAAAVGCARETKPGTQAEGKLAAIGVHISRGVTSHGFALNVNTDLSFFDLIIPCGITGKRVTSMHQELGQEMSMGKVAESVSRNFGFVFGSQVLWLQSLDELMSQPADLPLRVPENLRKLHGEEETFRA